MLSKPLWSSYVVVFYLEMLLHFPEPTNRMLINTLHVDVSYGHLFSKIVRLLDVIFTAFAATTYLSFVTVSGSHLCRLLLKQFLVANEGVVWAKLCRI